MKILPVLWLVACLALFNVARPAHAQTQGSAINVTVVGHTNPVAGASSEHALSFSAPVELPGVGLAPGAYIFRFVAPSVMQVLSENRSMVYAMFLVTPTWRGEVTHEYAVTLRTIADDAPARIATLFPPDASTGYEVTYPEQRPTKLFEWRWLRGL
jgi:hypothetical protein